MPKIIWRGIIKNPAEHQMGALSKNAKRLNSPKTMNEMMIKAFPFAIPSILILFAAMFFKTKNAGQAVISPAFIILGVALGLALLPVHELLHAIVYPSKAVVVIGVVPKQFAAVALASYPLKRSRFIVMCLLPYILGVIPLLLFCLTPPAAVELNGILFGSSIIGLTTPYADSYNVYQALRQTSKGDKLQFYGDNLCVIPDKP